MRVLYIAQFFNRPDEAGAGRHYAFATEWARAGHDVTVITGQQNYRTGRADRTRLWPYAEMVDGVRVVRTWVYTGYRGSFKKRFLNFGSFLVSATLAALGERRPDVVMASSPPLTVALAGRAIATLKRAPLVADIRDLWPESAVALGVVGEGRFVRLASALARGVYRQAKRIVAVTGGIEQGLRDVGVPQEKIIRVTNGVDLGIYDSVPSPDPLRTELGLEDRFLCVYVGGMGILHDVGTVVEAARYLRESRAHFLMIGAGDDRARLKRLVEEGRLTNVTFHDPIPKSRVPGVLASADVCVYSLRADPFFRGTFPNKNFDYLAAARPVVLAVEGESRELVQVSGAGLVAPPGDPRGLAEGIRAVMAMDDEQRARMGARGREYVLTNYRRRDLAALVERELRIVCGEPVSGEPESGERVSPDEHPAHSR